MPRRALPPEGGYDYTLLGDVNAAKEVAGFLGVTHGTVLAWINESRLRSFFVGTHARILGGDLVHHVDGPPEIATKHDDAFDHLPELLDLSEVADFFRVCDATVEALLRRGELPFVKEHRQARRKVRREDLKAWVLAGGSRSKALRVAA